MLGIRYILYAFIIGSFLEGTAANARVLSKAEAVVCPNLRSCIGILRRHDASEFDYGVLGHEFQKFGLEGRKSLFDILESEAGNADVSQMIVALGALSVSERARVDQKWSKEKAARYLPLFLDGDLRSRDKILLTLGDPNPAVRENARQALLRLPRQAMSQPLSKNIVEPLLQGLVIDPMSVAAPYVERMNSAGLESVFIELLESENADIAAAAYIALHRQNPRRSFDLLLTQMKQVETPKQARVIGNVLVRRHAQRADGFYLKFAKDISTDLSFPASARAAGLHAVLKVEGGVTPDLLVKSSGPLAFLIRGQSQETQDVYLPVLKVANESQSIALVWKIANEEKWGNRDEIWQSLKGSSLSSRALRDLILSDDLYSVEAGLSVAGEPQKTAIRSQIHHPVKSIAAAARRVLKLKKRPENPREICRVSQFDLTDMLAQMPYFDSAWTQTNNMARVKLDRRALTTAHPTAQGWLAGYDLSARQARKPHRGGALVEFDNKTGKFTRIGDFSAPVALLPNRRLRLGETTFRFWVLDRMPKMKGIAAYQLDLRSKTQAARRVAILPPDAQGFSVAQNGDLLVTFVATESRVSQPPLRYTSNGRVNLACIPMTAAAVPPSTPN